MRFSASLLNKASDKRGVSLFFTQVFPSPTNFKLCVIRKGNARNGFFSFFQAVAVGGIVLKYYVKVGHRLLSVLIMRRWLLYLIWLYRQILTGPSEARGINACSCCCCARKCLSWQLLFQKSRKDCSEQKESAWR
jgi:hypothetical protein